MEEILKEFKVGGIDECKFCENYKPLPIPGPEDAEREVELPLIMKQKFAVLDALFELASVSGDLYILSRPRVGEMSVELFDELRDLTIQLKRFNDHFCMEY